MRGKILGTPGMQPLPPELQAMLRQAEAQEAQPETVVKVEIYPMANFGGTMADPDGGAIVQFAVPTGLGSKKLIRFPFSRLESVKAFADQLLRIYEEQTAALFSEGVEVLPPPDEQPTDSAQGNPSPAQVEALLGNNE